MTDVIQITLEDPNGLMALVNDINERAHTIEMHAGNLIVILTQINRQLERIANALEGSE